MADKCTFNRHAWIKDWTYISSTSCSQQRNCGRCNFVEHREYHVWKDWRYEQEDSCVLTKSCERCGERERNRDGDAKTKVEHEWNWEFVQDDACLQIQICKRCRDKKADFLGNANARTQHTYSWVQVGENPCTQMEICQRCRERKSDRKKEAHQFGDWEYEKADACEQVKICQRCGEKEKLLFNLLTNTQTIHVWGDWEKKTACIQERICVRCNKVEQQETHQWTSWEFNGLHTCYQGRRCPQCEVIQHRLYPHQWNDQSGNLDMLSETDLDFLFVQLKREYGDIAIPQSLETALDTARRSLANLDAQAAGYTTLTMPSHLTIEIEDKQKEITRLEMALKINRPQDVKAKKKQLQDTLLEFQIRICLRCGVMESLPSKKPTG